MIKAVIFDYGGVVLKSPYSSLKDIAVTYEVSIEILIKKIQPFLKLFQKGLINENQFWKQLSSVLKKPVPKNKEDLWRKGFEETFYIYPEIINFVQKLKTQSIKTAVLSNTIKPHVDIITKHDGYKDFNIVILSREVNLQKPDSEIYLLTIKQLGTKPEECVFIDDKDENLRPAKKLGMKTILAKNPKQVIDDASRIIDLGPSRA